MKWKEALTKWKQKSSGLGKPFSLIAAIGLIAFVAIKTPFFTKTVPEAFYAMKSILKVTDKAIESTHGKVVKLSEAVYERDRLRLENMKLRRWIEGERFNCQALSAQNKTEQISLRLGEKTGATVGRTLASIDYRPPTHLLPHQLLTLAVSYFKARENEKSAVIMTFLTGQEQNDAYKTPKNFLMTGVSWYRIDHFKLAESYFQKVLEFPPEKANLPYQAQARLWSALSSKKRGQENLAQNWLRDLLDHHPHSSEAAWVNRGLASK